MDTIHHIIAQKTSLNEGAIKNVIKLLDEGATVPFISRYRKEATNGLDEVKIGLIKDWKEKIAEISKRKETITSTINEQGKLSEELKRRIEQTWDSTELEDIYLPYKPKRQTKAEKARKKGLEPLAQLILLQKEYKLSDRVKKYLNSEVESVDEALEGAKDIIAEYINEHESARNKIRGLFRREAILTAKVVKGKEKEAEKYQDYFDFSQPLRKCNSHRLLAIRRAEKEGFLKVDISPVKEDCIESLDRTFVRSNNDCSKVIRTAIDDSYKRLIKPSIENEFAALSKEKADQEAILVFASNLKQLLLSSPLGQKRVMGVDPGFRTGCKVVCLDEQGDLLHNENIYPHPPVMKKKDAAAKISKMVEAYHIEAIAIGNGTASRETEAFISNLSFPHKVQLFVVSEQGASIYSASATAREEFPEYDVTVRGAVSIGRRLMDPLAELVKIDPQSIGVGQYQHDVDSKELKKSLDQTVESCVNSVGINLNTASKHLLNYVSGLGSQLAQNIVDYRSSNGMFTSRAQLLKVPRLGKKAYEQCAGFLRITDAKNPLDNTAVHPESYPIVEKMAKDNSCSVNELIEDKAKRGAIHLNDYVSSKVGLPTLTDIMEELDKPGRDPREIIKVFEFDPTVRTIDDLKIGQILPAIISNITNFGAFADIGIKENGLIHLSQMANRYISSPSEVVSMHQQLQVKVVGIDKDRKRISLSLKDLES